VEYRSLRHRGWSNLTQYRYVQKKYAKKTRALSFWATTGLVVVLIGSLVVVQMSEPDAERKARTEKLEGDYLSFVYKLGKSACGNSKRVCPKAELPIFRRKLYSNEVRNKSES
jgi:hypothetical protein